MNRPKVSVIVPVYNVERFLDRCIQSILIQSFFDYEVILVDDGSLDNSPQICDAYAKTEKRISVIHKENGGLSSARLAGFREAKGEYILFVDSDDYIEPSMVEKLVDALEKNDAEISICAYNTVLKDSKIAKLLPYKKHVLTGKVEIIKNYILPLIGNIPSKTNIPGFMCIRMHRKSLIQESYFKSERIYYKEDHVFDLYYADSISSIAVVNEPLYNYCVNWESLSNSYRKNKWNMYLNLYEFYQEYLNERHILDCQEYLNYHMLSAMFASIDNAVVSGDYHTYQKELDLIVKNNSIQKILSEIKGFELSKIQYIICLLLITRNYKLLYHIRRNRLRKL